MKGEAMTIRTAHHNGNLYAGPIPAGAEVVGDVQRDIDADTGTRDLLTMRKPIGTTGRRRKTRHVGLQSTNGTGSVR